jgi:hypothetical protein
VSTCVYGTRNGKQVKTTKRFSYLKSGPIPAADPSAFVRFLHRSHQSLFTPALAAEKTVKL